MHQQLQIPRHSSASKCRCTDRTRKQDWENLQRLYNIKQDLERRRHHEKDKIKTIRCINPVSPFVQLRELGAEQKPNAEAKSVLPQDAKENLQTRKNKINRRRWV